MRYAVVYRPGRALFGADLLDLTVRAYDAGINLTGEEIRKVIARDPETGGYWIPGNCEPKHYLADGRCDN